MGTYERGVCFAGAARTSRLSPAMSDRNNHAVLSARLLPSSPAAREEHVWVNETPGTAAFRPLREPSPFWRGENSAKLPVCCKLFNTKVALRTVEFPAIRVGRLVARQIACLVPRRAVKRTRRVAAFKPAAPVGMPLCGPRGKTRTSRY